MLLPKEQWSASWHGKYTCPVVKLEKSLHGHPGSGTQWNTHCSAALKEVGVEPVRSWHSVLYHAEHSKLLRGCVDDVKLAAPSTISRNAGKQMRTTLDVGPLCPFRSIVGMHAQKVHG